MSHLATDEVDIRKRGLTSPLLKRINQIKWFHSQTVHEHASTHVQVTLIELTKATDESFPQFRAFAESD